MARLQDKASDSHRDIQRRGSEWGSSGELGDDGTAGGGGGGGGGGVATPPPARPSSRSSRRTSRPRNSALASSMAGAYTQLEPAQLELCLTHKNTLHTLNTP
jgi:hypothetical protein